MLVPVLCASDDMDLTNFSGNSKVWAEYMSIGNIRSSIQNKPRSYTSVAGAIVPYSTTRIKKVPVWSEKTQVHEARQVVHELTKFMLHPLGTSARHRHVIKCQEEVVRNCYLRVAGCLANHLGNTEIYRIHATRYTICDALTTTWLSWRNSHYVSDSNITTWFTNCIQTVCT